MTVSRSNRCNDGYWKVCKLFDCFGEEKLMKSIFHNCRNPTVTRWLVENIIGSLGVDGNDVKRYLILNYLFFIWQENSIFWLIVKLRNSEFVLVFPWFRNFVQAPNDRKLLQFQLSVSFYLKHDLIKLAPDSLDQKPKKASDDYYLHLDRQSTLLFAKNNIINTTTRKIRTPT